MILKASMINYSKEYNNHSAAIMFTVADKRISEWCQKEKDILKLISVHHREMSVKNFVVGESVQLKEQVIKWNHERRPKCLRVSGKPIMKKAKIMHNTMSTSSPEENFL